MALKWTPALEQRSLTLTIAERGGRVDHLVTDSLDNQSHYTTGFSCDCAEFIHRGSCVHHTFLLDSLGWSAAPVSATAGMETSR